jgi:hypothetical protein
MEQPAPNLFNNSKFTGGICLSATQTAPLVGVIKSRPLLFERGFIMGQPETKKKQGHGSAPGARPKDKKKKKTSSEKAKNKLFNYLDMKFSEQKAVSLLHRFFIEAAGVFAAKTPGNQCSTEEHRCYSLNKLIEALSIYTPQYQREMLAKYITDILPKKDANYDQAEDEAIFSVLFGSVERGQYVRDCIQSLHRIPTEELEGIKWHLQAKEC